jgi:hypothetical protein
MKSGAAGDAWPRAGESQGRVVVPAPPEYEGSGVTNQPADRTEEMPPEWAEFDPEEKHFVLNVPLAAADGIKEVVVRYVEETNDIQIAVRK